MADYGIIKQVFASGEDVVNPLEENIIEMPDEDPTIPTEDADDGSAAGDTSAIKMRLGGLVAPDANDII